MQKSIDKEVCIKFFQKNKSKSTKYIAKVLRREVVEDGHQNDQYKQL